MTKSPTDCDRLIGSVIRARRLLAGLSQADLGEALGVTFQQVQKYEIGSNRISFSRAVHLAEIIGCAVQDLLVMPEGPSETEP